MDYNKLAITTKRLVYKNGRDLLLYKLKNTAVDLAKSWRGAGTPVDIDELKTKGVFAIGNTSIPTESRGLAFDWVDSELLRISRHVVIIAARDLPILEDYKIIKDSDGSRWDIIWGQCLQPGPIRLMYCFGLKQ